MGPFKIDLSFSGNLSYVLRAKGLSRNRQVFGKGDVENVKEIGV
jgi:hypothetical protein